MSVGLKGIDLNCEAGLNEENQECCFDNKSLMNETPRRDAWNSGIFSSDGARVLGEINESSNVELKTRMDGVSYDEVETLDSYSACVPKPGIVTSYGDGDLKLGLGGFDGAIVAEKMEVNHTEETRVFPQNSCKESGMSFAVDLNLRQEEEIFDKGTGVNLSLSGGLDGDANTYIQGSDCTISQHAKIKEAVTVGEADDPIAMDVNPHALIPKKRAKGNQVEKEGDFYLSDLVWGKVRSHPWWPGQIIEPSAASEKAMKYFRKDSYLIAYFGDQTFAWNEASKTKPFRMYFSQMKKQSNVEAFCDAVDGCLGEVSRRIEFGLACQCLPEDVLTAVRFQVLINPGIREKATNVYGGDSFSTATSFFPEKLTNYLKALAGSPRSDYDVLEFVIARAQLLAFNRWKGYYQLPVLEEMNGFLGNDADLLVSHKEENLDRMINGDLGSRGDYQAAYGNRKSPPFSLHLHKPIELWRENSSSSFQNGEFISEGKAGRESAPRGRKRKGVGSVSSERRGKSGRRGSQQAVNASESGASDLTLAECPPTSEIFLKLCVGAASPMEGYYSLKSIAGVLCNFRNSISLEYSKCKEETMSSGKLKTAETFGSEGIEDTYWTDRVIQSNLDEKLLSEPEITAKSEKHEVKTMAINESSEEQSPTILILNFSDLESVPSIANLNQIFERFGPLEESKTEVLSKSKRAKLVFKRRSDAECAFSSAGKFSIFGPSLVSYRLKYEASPSKSSSTKRLKV